jgi:putative FmdB family regulatory protein
MPIYEYCCQSCGHVFEELILRSADLAALKCPNCGAPDLDRVLSAPAPVASCDTGGG